MLFLMKDVLYYVLFYVVQRCPIYPLHFAQILDGCPPYLAELLTETQL